MALLNKLFTMTEAAERLQLMKGRLTQLCQKFNLGTRPGREVFLSEQDIEAIREYRKKFGRNRTPRTE